MLYHSIGRFQFPSPEALAEFMKGKRAELHVELFVDSCTVDLMATVPNTGEVCERAIALGAVRTQDHMVGNTLPPGADQTEYDDLCLARVRERLIARIVIDTERWHDAGDDDSEFEDAMERLTLNYARLKRLRALGGLTQAPVEKYDPGTVRLIRHLANGGWSQTDIAAFFATTQPHVSRIVNRETHAEVED